MALGIYYDKLSLDNKPSVICHIFNVRSVTQRDKRHREGKTERGRDKHRDTRKDRKIL